MWAGRRIGNNWMVGASLPAIGCGALLLGAILIGVPIALVVALIQAIPHLTGGEWAVIAAIGVPVAAICVWYWRLPGDDIRDEDDAELEPVRLRPNRLRQPKP
jgi:hypothetical protein